MQVRTINSILEKKRGFQPLCYFIHDYIKHFQPIVQPHLEMGLPSQVCFSY